MGVTGLWALLAPTSTQIDLSSLQGKILAIGSFKLRLFREFYLLYLITLPRHLIFFDLNI